MRLKFKLWMAKFRRWMFRNKRWSRTSRECNRCCVTCRRYFMCVSIDTVDALAAIQEMVDAGAMPVTLAEECAEDLKKAWGS